MRLVACEMSCNVMEIRKEDFIDGVEMGGVATFIAEAMESKFSASSRRAVEGSSIRRPAPVARATRRSARPAEHFVVASPAPETYTDDVMPNPIR